MRTLEFTRSLTEISKELKIATLVGLLTEWMTVRPANQAIPEEEKNRFTSQILDSRSAFGWLNRDETAHRILDQLNVPEVYETERFRRILNAVTVTPNLQNIRSLEMFGLFEVLKSIQRIEVTCRTLLEADKVGPVEPSSEILTLQVVDYDGRGIEAARLLQIISRLIELHMNVAHVLGTKDDKLRFKYFDSGSDVILALQGATAVIVAMGGLLLQFWAKVRFRDNEAFERDIDSLSKGLDFVAKVQEAVETNTLTEEEARNLKARVFNGVDALVGLGTTSPLEASAVDQRQLLIGKRNMKLLGTGSLSEGDQAEPRSTADRQS